MPRPDLASISLAGADMTGIGFSQKAELAYIYGKLRSENKGLPLMGDIGTAEQLMDLQDVPSPSPVLDKIFLFCDHD